MHWFLDPILHHYADFSGRASRMEYWMFSLTSFLVLFGIAVLALILGVSADENIALLLGLIFFVALLGILIPSVALFARRLHDVGLSGFWMLLALIPFGGLITFIFAVLPSQKGTNKYGPNPYESSTSSTPVAPQVATADVPPSPQGT